MLEYIIILTLAMIPIMAAKRRFNLRRVRMNGSLAIGALATKDVISGNASASPTIGLRIMSVNATYTISNIGASDDDSFEFGWAHSDYSAAEIEEALEASATMDAGDRVAQEQANRLVRLIGTVSGALAGAAGGGANFNDGKPVKTKLNWLLTPGDTMDLWVRNGSGTIYTTGASLQVVGDFWVKDSV